MKRMLSYALLGLLLLVSCNKETARPDVPDVFEVKNAGPITDLNCDGAEVKFVVNHNVDYLTEISNGAKDWILPGNEKTLLNDTLSFNVAANHLSSKPREGRITFTPTAGNAVVFTVSQKGYDLNVRLTGIWEDLMPGETSSVGYELYGGNYDPKVKYTVKHTSSNPSVLTINASGSISALRIGRSTVTVTVSESGKSASREYIVTDYSSVLSVPTSANEFFLGQKLKYNSVMQSWDIAGNSRYFVQLNSTRHMCYLTNHTGAATRTEDNNAYMGCYYAGHADNMAAETASDGNVYLWLNNYGSNDPKDNGRYINSQTVCRTLFLKSKSMLPEEFQDHFVCWRKNDHLDRLSVAIDADNDLLALWGKGSKSGVYELFVVKLSEALALQPENITLDPRNYGGDSDQKKPVTTGEVKTIKARNLYKLTPVYNFNIPYWDNYQHIVQGFDFHHGKLYYMYGSGDSTESFKNTACFYVASPTSAAQKKLLKSCSITWVTNASIVGKYATLGYWEPEGVKVKDGVIYLGWAGIDKDTSKSGNKGTRRANIFKYNL